MSTRRRARPPIWTQPAPGTRRPRLSREQLAEVGLRIADAEGFEALSMRRLADELGVGTMTLYHYVRTKDDLVALLDDAIMAEVLVPDGELAAHWRLALEQIARKSRGAFERHPWALQALQSARFGPNGLRHFEQSMAAVASTGLPLPDRMALLHVVDDYVFGYTVRATEERTRRVRDDRYFKAVVEFTTAQLAAGGFPHIQAMLGHGDPLAAWRRAAQTLSDLDRFETGLAVVLDGAAHRWKLPPPPPASRRRPAR